MIFSRKSDIRKPLKTFTAPYKDNDNDDDNNDTKSIEDYRKYFKRGLSLGHPHFLAHCLGIEKEKERDQIGRQREECSRRRNPSVKLKDYKGQPKRYCLPKN